MAFLGLHSHHDKLCCDQGQVIMWCLSHKLAPLCGTRRWTCRSGCISAMAATRAWHNGRGGHPCCGTMAVFTGVAALFVVLSRARAAAGAEAGGAAVPEAAAADGLWHWHTDGSCHPAGAHLAAAALLPRPLRHCSCVEGAADCGLLNGVPSSIT